MAKLVWAYQDYAYFALRLNIFYQKKSYISEMCITQALGVSEIRKHQNTSYFKDQKL